MACRAESGVVRVSARAGYLTAAVDAAPLEQIERTDLERLSDAQFLSGTLLPAMGLTGACPELFPDTMRPYLGCGTHHFQLPVQFGPYLAEVARRGVRSYLEVGVEHGGTFAITVELLRRFHPIEKAIAVDRAPIPPLIARYRKRRPEVVFAQLNSHSSKFRELIRRRGPFDLVLIDGDHTEEGCRRDFEAVRGHARMIALHDINEPHLGVRAVWKSLSSDEFELHEFAEQYAELLPTVGPRFGIGLAVAR